MASNAEFSLVEEHSWMQGFPNFFAKENGRWWKTRFWLVQLIISLLFINGLTAVLFIAGTQTPPDAVQQQLSAEEIQAQAEFAQYPERIIFNAFLKLIGLAAAICVVVISQDVIIRERQSGTAAWVLSKPVSRNAFVLSKLAGYGLGILIIMVLISGAMAYGEIYLFAHVAVPILPYLGMLALSYLYLFFFLALTVMIATLTDSRGAAIGIPLVLIAGYDLFLKVAPALVNFMPWNLVHSFENTASALAVVQGQPLPTWMPVITTAVCCLVFISTSLLKFKREEF